MKKFILTNLKNLSARKWFLIIIGLLGLFIILGFICFYVSFFTDFWRIYPEPYRFQTAFYRLQKSCADLPYGGMCKGHCGYQREEYRQEIADFLNKDKADIASKQIKEGIFNKKDNDCFKIELIDALYLSQQKRQINDEQIINPPGYLVDYLIGPGIERHGTNLVADEILGLYGQSIFSGELSSRFLELINDPEASCQAKSLAIENLGRYGNSEVTRPIFQKLIEENKDPENLWIAYEAAQFVNIPKTKDREFVKWCESIIWGDYNGYVKEKIIDVLNYYKNRVPEEKDYIISILKMTYSDESQDRFVRDNAASIIQYSLGEESEKLYPNPEISDEEFDEHYVNFPKFPESCRKEI